MTRINSDEYLDEMKKYIDDFKRMADENREKAREASLEALKRTGILDEEGNLKYPYNGEEPRGLDFSRGPKWNCEISAFQTSNQDKIQKVSVRQRKLK